MSKQHQFDFAFGQPSGDHAGRWVNGTVTIEDQGFIVEFHLHARGARSYGCQSFEFRVARAFDPVDFAAILDAISTGRFQTVTRKLELTKIDAGLESSIREVTENWPISSVDPSSPLANDLVRLREQLENIRRREMLNLAVARLR